MMPDTLPSVRIERAPYRDQAEDQPFTQDELDGLILDTELSDYISFDNADERKAAKVSPKAYRLVHLDDLDALRTDKGKRRFRGKRFVTVENAREVLPIAFRPFEHEGESFKAKRAVPTREAKVYTPAQVEQMRADRDAYREQKAAERAARVAERADLFERWKAGDADVELMFVTTRRQRYETVKEDRPI